MGSNKLISGGIGGIICVNKNELYFGSGGGSGHSYELSKGMTLIIVVVVVVV